ncbi:hypothetical protein J3R30DRAFT_3418468 [Lentinula aciculospora]|uniref:Small nuclear ribonucleoprotein Prp3 C-terminal domain-containing protein n=1 Tax=Lentinula aciculospora TaxID=153920 RepID=A0A9W9AW57_9AGAR|nr:hypothetical protein J3R30DRAFT_3418468 [Lentinula aciculospora]
MLHEEADYAHAHGGGRKALEYGIERGSDSRFSSVTFHALFTSHHLVSATKRRNLQQWSSALSLSGFAKVGYPGIIYAEGTQESVREYVDNVRAMQWLALRLRFIEPVPKDAGLVKSSPSRRRWSEFQKVGDDMEEMRRIGREKYVVEMGIGSAQSSRE